MSDEIYRVELTADERATVVFALGAYLGCMVRDRALTDDRLHRMLTIANKFGCSYEVPKRKRKKLLIS